ncbi:hypothetical protein PHMEG_00037966, partial [Phytophthora megakarya]
HQARIAELTDQVAQLQGQLRDPEAARQAAERRAEERVLDVNALMDFLMGNKPKINVMFNWMRLAALLHHFAEGTPIPEGWLTNINVVALDDPRCECPEYVKPSPRPGNGNSSSGSSSSRRRSVLDLSPPARNKRASTSGSRAGNRKRKASGARDVPMAKRVQKRKQSTRETEALQAKLPESLDDEVQDPSYELSRAELDKAARAEAAADNDDSSEESNGAETESKPAASHLSPADLRGSKTQKKSDKGNGSKSHSASSKFGLRVGRLTSLIVSSGFW